MVSKLSEILRSGSGMNNTDPDPYFFTHPVSRIRTGSRIRIRNTGTLAWFCAAREGGGGGRAAEDRERRERVRQRDGRLHRRHGAHRRHQQRDQKHFWVSWEYFSSTWIDVISASVSDPDLDWIRIQSGQCIRIRIQDPDLDPGSGSRSRRSKWPTNVEKFSCFEVPDVLFWGLKASKASSVTWTSIMKA